MKTKSLFFILLIAVYSISHTGCKKSNDDTPPPAGGGGPGTNEVWMQNNAFNPASITVSVNTTVKWINKDNFAHTVTSNTGSFNSGNIDGGGTYSHQFTTKGTFPYHCALHAGMTGTVVVQ